MIKYKGVIPHRTVKGFFGSDLDAEATLALAGSGYLKQFKTMADNDAICGAVMLAITKTFQSITWKAENDPKGLLKKSLENVNWYERMEEILSFLVYGHSVFELILKEDEDGDIVWDGMYTRPQDTIEEWLYTKVGVLEAIRQVSYGVGGLGREIAGDEPSDVVINMSKCLHFATQKTRNNPLGKSLFRNAYRDWYYRTNIEKLEAVGIERDLTGLPVFIPDENDELIDHEGKFTELGKWAWTTIQNIKRNKQEGLVIPTGWEFKLIGTPGQRQFDMGEVIGRYDAKIALSMLSQFLILGVINSSGSFALSKEQSNLFYKSITGFAEMIAHVINTQFIGCPSLGLLNDVEPPQLTVVGVDKPSMDELASFLGRLLKFNVLTPDDKLEAHLRNVANLPDADPATSRKPEIQKPVQKTENGEKEKKADDEENENAGEKEKRSTTR